MQYSREREKKMATIETETTRTETTTNSLTDKEITILREMIAEYLQRQQSVDKMLDLIDFSGELHK